MKRYGNLYKEMYDIKNLEIAHKLAKKDKQHYHEVQMIDENPTFYLKKLQKMLINKTYRTSKYKIFYKNDFGKTRKIYKLPYFPDRVAHWACVNVMEPYLLWNFTEDTYSAILYKGVHRCLEKVISDIKRDTKGCQYCLKFDIKHYYQTIDHEILKRRYAKIFKDIDLLWFMYELIDSVQTVDERDRMLIESLYGNGDREIGIPIGNLPSQYSGNLYLSPYDHFVKEQLGAKHYYRYADDIVILAQEKEELWRYFDETKRFMSKYRLIIKDNYQVFPTYERGIDFLGYRIFRDYVLLRKSVCNRMKRRMTNTKRTIEQNGQMTLHQWRSIPCYEGILRYCDSYHLKQKYIRPLEKARIDFYKENIKGG